VTGLMGTPEPQAFRIEADVMDVDSGAGVLALRAEAFGPRGAHTIIEMTIARPDPAEEGVGRARVLSWRQIR